MDLITLFACAMGGCVVGFLVASFSDSKIIRGLQDDNRADRRAEEAHGTGAPADAGRA